MTTGRINQVATLSKPFLASRTETLQTSTEQIHSHNTCKQVGVFGYMYLAAKSPSRAVIHWLASFLQFLIEPSFALNQRSENNLVQPQWGAQTFSAGQNAALANHKSSTRRELMRSD